MSKTSSDSFAVIKMGGHGEREQVTETSLDF